jgi:hypothetical protein
LFLSDSQSAGDDALGLPAGPSVAGRCCSDTAGRRSPCRTSAEPDACMQRDSSRSMHTGRAPGGCGCRAICGGVCDPRVCTVNNK